VYFGNGRKAKGATSNGILSVHDSKLKAHWIWTKKGLLWRNWLQVPS
jgi:hypothetical protein